MIPTNVIQETEQRFADRTLKRTETAQKLKTGSKLLADEPARVEKRIRRLLRGGLAAEIATLTSAPVTSAANAAASLGTEPLALERILNKNNLMSVNYLERGLRVSRSVARIRITSGQQTLGFGTGFMVSPQLLMTNNHVLSRADEASFSQAEFNFQDDLTGRALPTSIFDLDPDLFFITDKNLDFTLIAVKEKARDGSGDLADLRFFGWNRLIEEQGKAILGEYLNRLCPKSGFAGLVWLSAPEEHYVYSSAFP